jgi:hypothetical protein
MLGDNMTFDDLKDKLPDSHEWKDISSEEYRIYVYTGFDVIRVEKPVALAISKSNTHRVVNAEGESFIIPPEWLCIRFKADPPFSF